jgi:hypothetical protein
MTNARTLKPLEPAMGPPKSIAGYGHPNVDSPRLSYLGDGPKNRRLPFLRFIATRKLESHYEFHSSSAITAESLIGDPEQVGASEHQKNLSKEPRDPIDQEQSSTHKIDSATPMPSSFGTSSTSDRLASLATSSEKDLDGRNRHMVNANLPIPEPDNIHMPLSYKIPQEVLSQALLAPPGTLAAYWKHSLYRGPPPKYAKVATHYCRRRDTCENVAQAFLEKKVLGFDMEWMPQASAGQGIKKNVSLIQFASEERVALFHIAAFGGSDTLEDTVIPTMKAIMENPNIIKVGVGIKGLLLFDLCQLHSNYFSSRLHKAPKLYGN